MQVICPRCCGLDVHKRSVTACVLLSDGAASRKEVRTFSTMPADLRALAAWLAELGVTHAAMESTGIYWQPVWTALAERCELLLVNAAHVKQVPGRKTDVGDAEWLADLLRHGLLRGSFVPDQAQRELRELTRLRTTRVELRAAEVNRLAAALERAGLRLPSVVTDLTGVSARAILAALLAGTTDPQALAELAKGRLRTKRAELERALAAPLTAHRRFLVAEHLSLIDELEEDIARLDALIAERLADQAAAVARLASIPGVGRRTAECVLAEVGGDMSRFPSSKHLASWAGVCPGNHLSAGKRKGGKARKGNPWLRRALVEAAKAAGRSKGAYLGALYRRKVAQRGLGKGTLAVAHAILVRIYCLLRDGTTYDEPGGNYFDERDKRGTCRRLTTRLERLGYQVTLTPLAAD